jgi:alkylhydroperoxidase family enzyme
MLENIISNILGKGKSELGLRKRIHEKVKNIVTTNTSDSLASNELNVYVEKIARNAYKVVDEDIATLKELGMTEDEIFEFTIVAAVSAGEARVKLATNLLDN